MKYDFIYITVNTKEEAKRIGEALVADRLAACANIIDNMNSIYWWDDKLQYDSEAVLILKTRSTLAKKLIKKVKELHRYTCPCIIALPIVEANKDYLRWIHKETKR